MEAKKLQSLHDNLEEKKSSRGSRGGLGRVKGTPGAGAVFRARGGGEGLPDSQLYRNFVRGQTMEANAHERKPTITLGCGTVIPIGGEEEKGKKKKGKKEKEEEEVVEVHANGREKGKRGKRLTETEAREEEDEEGIKGSKKKKAKVTTTPAEEEDGERKPEKKKGKKESAEDQAKAEPDKAKVHKSKGGKQKEQQKDKNGKCPPPSPPTEQNDDTNPQVKVHVDITHVPCRLVSLKWKKGQTGNLADAILAAAAHLSGSVPTGDGEPDKKKRKKTKAASPKPKDVKLCLTRVEGPIAKGKIKTGGSEGNTETLSASAIQSGCGTLIVSGVEEGGEEKEKDQRKRVTGDLWVRVAAGDEEVASGLLKTRNCTVGGPSEDFILEAVVLELP
uniref:Uncharacterized protein n=1 Tax=Chromera velia CCMP2878 TaxID=1169474 RepID=A0A0G4HK43_9ALVE|eukprot:Cvel_7150.t1-p1 / transcript=Cvel_7150.t1 / gene=Cvel_7150 / organism=Chromera_velia_CCMP2878 / gene_product=hypothetical protein / transcript_product=hypothetical protein / location=Cvel_scaffold368:2370-5853(-) / protein_length=389 / sequence_SO=supercontig / SO=protein_coding / is_pseudo=false